MRWAGGNGGGEVEEAGLAVHRQGQEAVAGKGERLDQFATEMMVVQGGSERGVDGKIELTGVTGRNLDALEFSVLKADEEGAVGAVVRGASDTSDIIPGCVSGGELVRRLE